MNTTATAVAPQEDEARTVAELLDNLSASDRKLIHAEMDREEDMASHYIIVHDGVGAWQRGEVVSLADMFGYAEKRVDDRKTNVAYLARYKHSMDVERLLALGAIEPCAPPPDCLCSICHASDATVRQTVTAGVLTSLDAQGRLVYSKGHRFDCKCVKCKWRRLRVQEAQALGEVERTEIAEETTQLV